MRTLARITLTEPLTRDKIDDLVATELLVGIQVLRSYRCGDVPELLSLLIPSQVSAVFLDAFKEVIDEASFIHEVDAIVIVSKFEAGKIDSTDSYIRDEVSTAKTDVVPSFTPLGVVFTVGGLSGLKRVALVVEFRQTLTVDQVNELQAIGIEVDPSSTGDNISILSTICGGFMVEFQQPKLAVGNYVFDYEFKGKILEL